jgi:peptidoglycan hydrolase CwlO-like protein
MTEQLCFACDTKTTRLLSVVRRKQLGINAFDAKVQALQKAVDGLDAKVQALQKAVDGTVEADAGEP